MTAPVITLLLGFLALIESISCKGCVPLDSLTFDKVTSKFKASLVKFDTAYPYGPKHEEYVKVGEAAHMISDLLVAEVGIKDYGEMENSDLAAKYKVKKDEWPVIKLFVDGKIEPFMYTGEFTADEIKKFIRSNSGVYIGLPGCLEKFDMLAIKFSSANDAIAKRKILREAEDLWDSASGKSEQKAAEVYVKTMRKVIDKGNEFVTSEVTRVENLINGKVSKDKKEEMQYRVNILQSFKKEEL